MHTHTHQLLTAHLSLIQRRDNSRDKDIICICCWKRGFVVLPLKVAVDSLQYLSFFLRGFSSSERRYRSWDGYGREMSESGSVFRHGTLRWTYAARSKPALCLPQCIPNRSDKVPPLCDPDPLLIMDRLQNRPLRGRTGPALRAAVCAAAHWWTHTIRHVNFHAVWQPRADSRRCEVFLSPRRLPSRMWLSDRHVCASDSYLRRLF